ncbi:hypothetical protein FRC04_003516 [Tulasnella sp. 424]|nr:hypothetical protein FRC04_003516 [Tulasnella sp. 424]KAG8962874.1 hypothetical protein FRC05_005082 [Tulasnella sp. 425]
MTGLPLDTLDPNIDPQEFFSNYVAKRKPAILRGLPNDPTFRAKKWTDIKYLKEKAGHVQLMVEPMDQKSKQFGTGVQRVSMGFRDFLDSLQSKNGPYHYLTTQYSDDDDVPQTFPPPTNALKDDFPLVPMLMGNLVLQQVNLWVGKSKEGSSSGLHHDFHDNLYCLLQGRKRFVLYPPSQSHHLHPHGKIKKVHPNGLISYEHNPVRSDGLNSYDAAKYKMQALKRRMSELKSGSKTRTMEAKLIKKAYEEARNAFRELQGDSADADLAGNDADDADAILARLEAQEKKGKMNENEEEEWGGIGGNDEDESNDQEEEDPSSFSGIPTSVLHSYLNLPTTTAPPSSNPSTSSFLSSLKSAGPPFVVNLKAGEMLYLPASWWHEVTSSSSSPSDIHMAFNYWFHPPNATDRFMLPYKDSSVWKYLRDEQRAAYGVKRGLKRKTGEEDAPATSTKPINKKKRLKL